jgi:transcriptional regulator with XRE-family HTH domain
MADATNVLIIECRMALGLTQEDFGNIVGRTKRTVQRWEDGGAVLVASEGETLARALISVRPDLAEKIAEAIDTTLDALGLAPTVDASGLVTPGPVDAIVRAAADAMGVTPDVVRPAVAAAFERARELGLDVEAVARALGERGRQAL